MQSFLKVADARKADNEVVRTCVAEIRELAYDAEDAIENFALKVASRRKGEVGEGSSSSTEWRELRRPYPHIIDDNIVGLDDDLSSCC
ncbi:hypothetical protein PTKIN_Ptkin14bG0150100 [Pterospermum kingtungense]